MDARDPSKATASKVKKGSKESTFSLPQLNPRSSKPAVPLPPYASSESQTSSLRKTVHSGVRFSSKSVHMSQQMRDSLSFFFDDKYQSANKAEHTSDNITSEKNTEQASIEPSRRMSYADIVRNKK